LSEQFDHTSTLRFLERRFGVIEPNISAWRRQIVGDITSATLPPPTVPGAEQRFPRQEPGHRPHTG
jgi:phospholipase C